MTQTFLCQLVFLIFMATLIYSVIVRKLRKSMSTMPEWVDPNYIYHLHFKVYGATGYWKIKSATKWKEVLFTAYFCFVHTAFNALTIALLIDAYIVREDIEKMSTNLCSSITCVGTFFKVWIFNFNRGKIEEMCVKLENNLYIPRVGDDESDKSILEKHAKIVARASRILWVMDLFLFIFWSIFPVLDSGSEARYPFPFPVYNASSPVYEIIYVYHVFVLLTIAYNVLTYDMIFYGFIARVCAQYEIVAKNISGIKNLYSDETLKPFPEKRRNDEVIVKIIKANVNHHRAILRQIKEIEGLFSIPIFVQIICGASLIAVIAYGIITKSQGFTLEQMQRVFYVGCALFDIWLYCYFGTQLEIKSNQVREALYDNPWYEMKTETRKLYMIMINLLQRKVKIRGGGIFQVTLKTYLALLKISYNLTAILRQTVSRT